MQTLCRFSGITLNQFDDGWQLVATSCHPLFLLTKEQLLAFIAKHPPRTPAQQRLAFLSLLHKTELCIWAAPFSPTDEEIEVAKPELARLLSALGRLTPDQCATLPKVRLAADVSICDILDTWNKLARGLPVAGYATNADIALAISEQWHRNSGGKLAQQVIDFALDQLAYHESDARVLQTFRTALGWTTSTVPPASGYILRNLLEICADALPMNDASRHKSFLVQRHAQNLLDHCTKLMAELGGNKVVRKEKELAGVGSFEMVEVSAEDARKEIAEFNEPLPQRQDFARELDYIKAKAKWQARKYAAKAG